MCKYCFEIFVIDSVKTNGFQKYIRSLWDIYIDIMTNMKLFYVHKLIFEILTKQNFNRSNIHDHLQL